jgi:predicted MFS family arabinose efflux permease
VFIVGSVAGLAVARYATTRDTRPVILVAGLVGGASIAAIGQATTVWQAYLAYAGMGISFIACGTGPTMLAVLRHADPGKRARTLAVATVGISLGGVVLSPVAVLTIDLWGFATATLVFGVFVAVLVSAVVLLIMPPSPPPPRDAGAPGPGGAVPGGLEPLDPLDVVRDVPYRRALRSPALWLTTGATALFFCAQIGGIAHIVRLCSERDLGVAGAVVAIMTASAVVSRLIGSRILERVPLWRWVVVVLVLQAVSLAMFSLARSTPAVVAAALLLGVVVGNSPIIMPMMVVETFGMLDYPRIQALQQILVSIAQGVGPVLLSVVHDRLGGYPTAYLTAAAVSVSACLVAVLAGRAAGRVPRTLRQQGLEEGLA